MKRRVCSYDMLAVPDPPFVLKDAGGEMYFCNLRCFCIWSVQLATRPNLSEEDKTGAYSLITPTVKNISLRGLWMWRGGRLPMLLHEKGSGAYGVILGSTPTFTFSRRREQLFSASALS
jgi:hypothetical protein